MKIVCVFGDSITYGESDYKLGGWVNQLRLFFNNKIKEDVFIYNLGVPGENSSDLLARFEQEAKIRKPNFVLFAIGTNDIPHGEKGVGFEKSKKNFLKLIEISKSRKYDFAFVGLTSVDEALLEGYRKNKDVQEYNKMIKELCELKGIDFISLISILSPKDLTDGVHPNFKGHKKIFEEVRKYWIGKFR